MNLRFPTVKIASQAEFTRWFEQAKPVLDQRWLYEQNQIKAGESEIRDGTCGLCLTPTQYRSALPAAQRNWREEMQCGCLHKLNNRHRAVLHYLRAQNVLVPAQALAVIGPETTLEARLAEWGIKYAHVPRLVAGRLQAPDDAFGVLVSSDYLQHVPAALAMLQELGRIARRGGILALTVPFDVSAAKTRSRTQDQPRLPMDSADQQHLFGWDLLDALRDAGFADVAVHFYWSDEFGYLGPFNMIVTGTRL